MTPAHVVIVGGGISGLAAALRLSVAEPDVEVTLLERSASVGGKLRLHQVDGMTLDAGAESLLARRGEGVGLIKAVGLEADLVSPAATGATIWSEESLHPMPRQQLLGIPLSVSGAAETSLLDDAGLRRLSRDLDQPGTAVVEDTAVGSLVRDRLGPQVVERLVEPLLGGVYAGAADRLSLDMAMPGLIDELGVHPSLMRAARSLVERSRATGPVFASVAGGLGRLPDQVARVSGATIRCGSEVLALRPQDRGWLLDVRTGADEGQTLDADAVILACDAPTAGGLVRDFCPRAGSTLSAVEYASVALVTYVFEASTGTRWPSGTGFLVPPAEGLALKAATFLSQKWSWIQQTYPDAVVVRASAGRFGEDEVLALDDVALANRVLEDLRVTTAMTSQPRASVVTRWPHSLPQYLVGHRPRVARARQSLQEQGRIELCGAAVDGVGIPACIASGQRAATQVANLLREKGQ